MNIISASRRTDIPKFYTKWFLERVREGKVAYRNPFSGHLYEISLHPEDVRAIVFWSKDFRPLERYLEELDRRGLRYYFQFTITGLPRIFEERVPDPEIAVATAKRLAARTSPGQVQWRFDPIVLSDRTQAEATVARFARLAHAMEGVTGRCYISFMARYAKVTRNLASVEGEHRVRFREADLGEKRALAARLAAIAARHGIAVVSCCNDALIHEGPGFRVGKGRCVDGELIDALFPERAATSRPGPTREQCGCVASRDIGAYDTCPHGCFYCYANASKERARDRCRSHDPHAMILG
jgi:hypothetical protein